jgi:hypothetical protein
MFPIGDTFIISTASMDDIQTLLVPPPMSFFQIPLYTYLNDLHHDMLQNKLLFKGIVQNETFPSTRLTKRQTQSAMF